MSTALTLFEALAETSSGEPKSEAEGVCLKRTSEVHWNAGQRPPERQGLAFYRKYTEAMLRRFMRLSMRVGRMPSFLGQDVFRGRMSTYQISSFEDAVIFVYDMEKCIQQMDDFSQNLITRIALQEYTQGEAARLLGVSLRTIVRRYGEALDGLTQVLLDRRLMRIDQCTTEATPER